MGREIKFRGKDIETSEWRYGYLVSNNKGKAIIVNILNVYGVDFPFQEFEIDVNTIGQFTGLEDSRRVKVYEGDIVKDEGSEQLYVIYFSVKELRFVRCPIVYFTKAHEKEREYSSCAQTLEWWNRIKRYVVGNVFDNPELLKKDKEL